MAKKATKPKSPIHSAYESAKVAVKADCLGVKTSRAIRDLALDSLAFLNRNCDKVDLKSLVPGKNYIAYRLRGSSSFVSRPINTALFDASVSRLKANWNAWATGKKDGPQKLSASIYTAAIAPCAVMEVFDKGNKKGPATYFECLIGHVFARELGVNPRKQASLPVLGQKVRLTMDFLFDHDGGLPSTHMPVKMSTRERIVQAWAHHRMLDSAFGVGKYKGIMVLFSETKLDLNKLEVVEICVPDQWLAYQTMLAKMDRIYYFDVPARYQELTQEFPKVIQIKPISKFFGEKDAVLSP